MSEGQNGRRLRVIKENRPVRSTISVLFDCSHVYGVLLRFLLTARNERITSHNTARSVLNVWSEASKRNVCFVENRSTSVQRRVLTPTICLNSDGNNNELCPYTLRFYTMPFRKRVSANVRDFTTASSWRYYHFKLRLKNTTESST